MEFSGISKLDLKRQNRMIILRGIRKYGRTSRVDLSEVLQLTRAAITIITNEMLEEGILEQLGEEHLPDDNHKKGRRKILLGIRKTAHITLGASIQRGSVNVGLCDLEGSVIDSVTKELAPDATGALDYAALITSICRRLIKKHQLSQPVLLGLGVGIAPSMLGSFFGEHADQTLSDFTEKLQKALHLPVCCDNAVHLLAMASVNHRTENRADETVVFITGDAQDSGYYAAVVQNDRLLSFPNNPSGTIDRIVIQPEGAEYPDYPRGSVQAELSASVLKDRLTAAVQAGDSPVLASIIADGNLTPAAVKKSFEEKDSGTVRILNAALDQLASLIHNYIISCYADHIYLYQCPLADLFYSELEARLDAWTDGEFANCLVRNKLTPETCFLGGALYAIETFFYERGGLPVDESGSENR